MIGEKDFMAFGDRGSKSLLFFFQKWENPFLLLLQTWENADLGFPMRSARKNVAARFPVSLPSSNCRFRSVLCTFNPLLPFRSILFHTPVSLPRFFLSNLLFKTVASLIRENDGRISFLVEPGTTHTHSLRCRST